jgi:hypothetical protein
MLIRSRLMVGLVFLMMIIIGLITSLNMRRIIYDKAYTLESDIHYGRMIDTTLQIAQVMKDSLQMEMNDLSLSKALIEDIR